MNERPIDRLLGIMAALRDPRTGCPWDRAQTFASLAPYAIEESYEVRDAIERGDMGALRDELGDLLFQVVFQSRIAEESGQFDFGDVACAIAEKLVRRHPHVFGGAEGSGDAADWEAIKARERSAAGDAPSGGLAGVARALPSLTRAVKLQDRAALAGFDWPDVARVLEKVEEEIGELRAELAAADPARLDHEVGDVLMAVSNVARHLGVDSEQALHRANRRFEERYARMEALSAADGRRFEDATLEEQEALWLRAKAELGEGD